MSHIQMFHVGCKYLRTHFGRGSDQFPLNSHSIPDGPISRYPHAQLKMARPPYVELCSSNCKWGSSSPPGVSRYGHRMGSQFGTFADHLPDEN